MCNNPELASGKWELWRRLLLLLCLAAAAWLYMYVSLAPLISVNIVDFSRQQEREVQGYYVTDLQRHLSALPLEDYVEYVTGGELIQLSGPEWENFANGMRAATKGNPPRDWQQRIRKHELEDGRVSAVYFRPDEEPVQSIMVQQDHLGEPVYLKYGDSGADSVYFSLQYINISHDSFMVGSGYEGLYEPPPYFFRPGRPYALWLLVAGLLLYLFLPRPRHRPGTMSYCGGSLVAADLVSTIFFMIFFTLPLLIMGGSVQALTEIFPLTVIFWGMALLGAWIMFISAWHASYALSVDNGHLVISYYGGGYQIPFSEIDYGQPAEKRYPRWLAFLTTLALIFTRRAYMMAAAGRVLLGDSAVNQGVRLKLKDGTSLNIWLTDQLGREILHQARNLPAALAKAQIPWRDEMALDRSLSYKPGVKRAWVKKPAIRTAALMLFMSMGLILISIFASNRALETTFPKERDTKGVTAELADTEIPVEYPSFAGLPVAELEGDWSVLYGGQGVDSGVIARKNQDGQYIVAGISTSFESRVRPALYLVLAGENGEVLWESTYPQVGLNCSPTSLIQTGDGGYAVAGILSCYTVRHAYLTKFDPAGEVEWEQEYPDIPNSSDLIQDINGGFVLTGHKGSHAFLMKADELGKEEWSTTLAAEQEASHAARVLAAPGGGYLVVGSVFNTGETFWNIYLARFCSEGTVEWEKHYGGTGEERGYSAALLADEGLVISGYSRSDVGMYRATYLLRVDREGEMIWEQRYITSDYDSTGIDVLKIVDENFVLLVDADSLHSNHRVAMLIQTNSRGEAEEASRLWVGGEVRARSINPAGKDSLLITGMAGRQEERAYGNSSMFLMKVTLP